MKFYRYIVCAFLFIGAAIAETININWLNNGETYAQTTCEIGGDVILPTTPTKRGHTFVGWTTYTRLEYIESTFTQYIDTGIKVSNTLAVEIFADITSATGQVIFGGRDGTSGTTNAFVVFSKTNDTTPASYRFDFSHTGYNGIRTGVYSTGKHLFYKNGKDNYVDGVKLDSNNAADTFTSASNAYLFGLNNNGTAYLLEKVSIYHCYIWDNGVLVRNFIPAKRNYDSAIGMYDTVSGQFFTNSGTGEFIAGPVAENQNFNE